MVHKTKLINSINSIEGRVLDSNLFNRDFSSKTMYYDHEGNERLRKVVSYKTYDEKYTIGFIFNYKSFQVQFHLFNSTGSSNLVIVEKNLVGLQQLINDDIMDWTDRMEYKISKFIGNINESIIQYLGNEDDLSNNKKS